MQAAVVILCYTFIAGTSVKSYYIIKKNIYLLLFLLFILFSVSANVYNVIKTSTEIKEWTPLTESQKRIKIFGNSYAFITMVNNHTKDNVHLLLYSKDDMTYYLTRYYLYPRIIIRANNEKEFLSLMKNNKFEYIAFYDTNYPLKFYKKVTSFTSVDSKDFGSLYIKE
jgi:hypothetical protein